MSPTVNAPSAEATAAVMAEFAERIVHTERQKAVDHMAAADITVSQIRILFTLLREEGMATHDLAAEVGLSLAAVVRAVDRLVAAGLVERREDASDRRVKRLSLTPGGIDMMNDQFRMKTESVVAMAGAVPPSVRERLVSAMTAALEYLPSLPDCHGCRVTK
ncbi:MAG: MarR family transcriptional regulator [Gordonia sp. (in: high G+C Gram-positive bacteria)]|uniref:MarR family winged helix-turn-helix transcriptional regulator n=1 Tax=Gordonia sp. (in: high G+C Gram-positive bacteria) TaxID=84139 RepID=UPI0039E40B65